MYTEAVWSEAVSLPPAAIQGAVEYSKLLIVDDDESSVRLLTATLRNAGYNRVDSLTDPREAPRHCADFDPDLMLIDFLMPHLDGLELMQTLRSRTGPRAPAPCLILTADEDPSTRRRALAVGASEFVRKPFDRTELVLRIRNLLEARRGSQALDQAQAEVVESLLKIAGYRDDETGGHARRVGRLAELIALSLGLAEDGAKLLGVAAALHDIGKVGIPDCILRKQGSLTADEFDLIRKHTTMGGEILATTHFAVLKLAQQIAIYHHERWDGGGYNGVKGEEIPIAARIVALADTFDVLTHDRPYRSAWSVSRALAEIRFERGRQFDPLVVDAFSRAVVDPVD